MAYRKLVDNVFEVGAVDWNRRSFDELVPLHEGTSYNSYLIIGSEKVALIDTVDPKMLGVLVDNLKEAGIKKIDYIISNHAEQDHSGSIPDILKLFPDSKVVTNPKCKAFLQDLLLIKEEDFITVNDNDKLSLGDKTLRFIIFPWVHWPETMLTYLEEDKILFSCDLFGSHVADSRLFATKEDEILIYEGALRYFSEIMYPFRDNIRSQFQKVLDLDIKYIAPSHGQVYENPEFIINCYKEWTSPDVKNKAVIVYNSMHGSTEKMVEFLTSELTKRNISVLPFHLSVTDIGRLAMEITDAATVIVGSSQVLGGMHPSVAYAVYFYNLLRPKTKFVSVIGSFGWGGKMLEQIQNMLYNLKAEFIPPVIAKGYPKEEDFKNLEKLADNIFENHKKIGVLK
ncbi:MAG: FprA family A-type flavoprotein [Brevinematia bacterium]